MMIAYQFLVSLEVFKGVGDELLSWVIIICDLKILSSLLFWLSSMLIKFIVIMFMSKMSVLDEF